MGTSTRNGGVTTTDKILARWRAFAESRERAKLPPGMEPLLAAIETALAAPEDTTSTLGRLRAVESAAFLLRQMHGRGALERARRLEGERAGTFARSVTLALEHEERRLAALRSYRILDSEPEPEFTEIAFIAAHVCGTPMAAINLVDRNREWTKASLSMQNCETPLAESACAMTLAEPGCIVVPDMREDARLSLLPAVRGERALRFYASAPLMTADGLAMGRLCVIDTKPHPEGVTPAQAAILESLARQVMAQIRLRRLLMDAS